ncbi:beta strand repeat-containing protein [Rhodopirellula sp. MGV]|uniref:beta strand repeat-containing protein n=1 Tax=Rhodopirellula sp. MGV TaxID=2023130 RepID=UPI000B965260|nr:integrin alpha [Rhodopirellula sp. MGV]OYP29456.1 hypothetical protein CGZ80_24990 [Rhodopirellula sp. MGV]PNY35762.1 hypothetical protein C2E31_16945 [Rhodopirellula baltica]
MSLRIFSRRVAVARHRPAGKRRQLGQAIQTLESRSMLAADADFLQQLPTAEQAKFGEVIVTDDGRSACPAFRAMSSGESEGQMLTSQSQFAANEAAIEVAGSVDVSVAISQAAGPVLTGQAFTSEVTFENAGPGSAENTELAVSFDAGLIDVQWEREVQRTIPATIKLEDINGTTGFSVGGADAAAPSGSPVTGIGDVNGDGIDDFAVGASNAIYVIYGSSDGFDLGIDLDDIDGSNGFVFSGFDGTGNLINVAGVGDLNDDGIGDVVLGHSTAEPNGLSSAGEAYVVFGSSTFGANFDVATLDGTNGFVFQGEAQGALLGANLDGAGDVNDDGYDDVILGAPGDLFSGTEGKAFVIYGAPSFSEAVIGPSSLDGANGFKITTDAIGANLGESVAGINDFNGDGIDDILVTASSFYSDFQPGLAYVIFGGDELGASVSVDSLTESTGIMIYGADYPTLGIDGNGLGDFNGDGLSDLVVVDGDGFNSNAYVVFGTDSVLDGLDLTTLDGSNGFVLPFDYQVYSGKAGDFNGDGLSDAVFANADLVGGFVVFGNDQTMASSVDPLAFDGTNGFKIEASDLSDVPFSGAFAGDINGDGFDDVLFGAPYALAGDVGNAFGRAFVVNGQGNSVTNGAGDIADVFDLQPGDRVIYRVAATVADDAAGTTTVSAVATVDDSETEDDLTNNTASATTTITPADTTAPTVVDVIVACVGGAFPWTPTFIDSVDDTGPSGPDNGLGFSVIGVERTIPWYTVDTIYIRYSETVAAPTDLELLGVSIADYAGNFVVTHEGDLTTISMTSAFGLPETDRGAATTGIDRLQLNLNAAGVIDLAGNTLADSFSQAINVLPGDGEGSGRVLGNDVGLANLRNFTTFGGAANVRGNTYDPFFDITADGSILGNDVGLINFQNFDELPPVLAAQVDQAIGELF